MRPFIRHTALALALLFLSGAGVAWIDLLKEGNVLSNPRLKAASAWLTTGLMLLALGVRGWRSRSGRANIQRPDDRAKQRAETSSPS